ncbi:GNAT family N-acetyltransferase [Arthrobacter sp. TMN-50]
MTLLQPVTLTGPTVTLEPLTPDHHDGLVDAACDGDLWNLWYTSVPAPAGMSAEIGRRLALQEHGVMLPFALRRNGTDQLLGMTTYCNIDVDTPRVEIGYTWNRASVQGTGTNPESKLLLLTHAFEQLGCTAVEFRTHWMNHQSREAIARLGAKQDGVLRAHRWGSDGSLRDTVVFSIVAAEWPMVKAGLNHQVSKTR